MLTERGAGRREITNIKKGKMVNPCPPNHPSWNLLSYTPAKLLLSKLHGAKRSYHCQALLMLKNYNQINYCF